MKCDACNYSSGVFQFAYLYFCPQCGARARKVSLRLTAVDRVAYALSPLVFLGPWLWFLIRQEHTPFFTVSRYLTGVEFGFFLLVALMLVPIYQYLTTPVQRFHLVLRQIVTLTTVPRTRIRYAGLDLFLLFALVLFAAAAWFLLIRDLPWEYGYPRWQTSIMTFGSAVLLSWQMFLACSVIWMGHSSYTACKEYPDLSRVRLRPNPHEDEETPAFVPEWTGPEAPGGRAVSEPPSSS
ncbi:MAG: hypothetical protein V1918_00310 [Planctomycetota bacterium]